MGDELFDILGEVADGIGVAGVPIKAIRAWRRRDEARNLMGELQREIDQRWRDAPTRSDLYHQIARHLQDPRLWIPFSAAAEGDADALEDVHAYLTQHVGTESDAASKEVALIVTEVLASHVGRAQTSPQAATDAVGRLRHGQAQRRFDALDERLERMEASQAQMLGELFNDIREGRATEDVEPNLARTLVLGPLRRIGAVNEVQAAEHQAEQGNFGDAADDLLSVAARLYDAGLGLAAESLQERASELLIAAERRPAAAGVLLGVARQRVDRGTNVAMFTIRALRQALNEDEQWIADALEAMSDWPGRGAAPVQTLRDAAARATGRNDELWFVAAAVDLLALFEQRAEVIEVAAPVAGRPLADGQRLAIELDVLEAQEATTPSPNVEQRWLALLRWADTEGSAESAGIAWQRRGAALAEREDVAAAHDAYRRAMDAWSTLKGYEEQAADAFYSMQAVSIVNAQPIPDAELRALAYSLRGSASTPAARIDQLLSRGMQERLRERGAPAALAAFWQAFALARRTGSLTNTLTGAERLAELHAHAREPYIALAFYLTASKGKEAAELARQLDPRGVAEVLAAGGSRWYRAAVYSVVAAVGRSLPLDAVARLADQILAESRKDADAWVAPQPAFAAKRALAAIALGVPAELVEGTFGQLVAELDHPQIDIARASAEALVLATNVGAFDATDALFELFALDPYNYGISVSWVAERLEAQPSKADLLRTAALEGKDPVLDALVLAGLVDDTELQQRCEQATVRWTAFTPTEETVVDGIRHVQTGMGSSVHDAGIVARAATPEARTALLEHLLELAGDSRHPQGTRASAAAAINNLAPALTETQAARALDVLLPLALGEYALSQWDSNMDHPLSAFQIALHEPGALRAAAIRAVARLTAEHGTNGPRLAAVVESALSAAEIPVVVSAFNALGQLDALTPPIPLDVAVRHPEPKIRQAALAAYLARQRAAPPQPMLAALVQDSFAPVRHTLIVGLRRVPGAGTALSLLADDADAYIRRLARRELERARAAET